MDERRYRLKGHAPARPSKLDLTGALNDAQREAVETDAPRVLILAGAGSGKTRTLTYRVARLIEKGAPPEGIILATFTNRAAREMVARIEKLLGASANRVRAGTFHALAYQALRRHAGRLGYHDGFGILDRDDQGEVMSAAIADAEIDVKARRFPSSDVLVTITSLAINTDRTVGDMLISRFPQFAALEEDVNRVIAGFTRRKLEMNVMDFDDLLLGWRSLFTGSGAAVHPLAAEIRHVLVDEFQDTTKLQADLAELLASECGSLSVVGDDAQSIYSFRGARFDNILDFPRRAPTEVHRLTINYRSVPQVLNLANEIIKKNPLQFPKDLLAERSDGALPVLVPARDPFQQGEFVAQRVLELRDEGIALAEQAILYRAHSHSVELQIELTKRGIPFVVRSGTRFFEQAHVKDLIAFLRVVANPLDDLSWGRVLGLLPGFGTRTRARVLEAIKAAVLERGDPLGALESPESLEPVPARARARFLELGSVLRALSSGALRRAPGEMIRTLLSPSVGPSLLMEHIVARYANGEDRIQELLQLADIASQHRDLAEFLGEIALVSDLVEEQRSGAEQEREWLTLSTVHQAKGLEWRAVFITGLTDGGFPHSTALEEAEGEAEERRLLYVAVTRAREQLYLCYPGSRFIREGERVLMRPSRFISELAGTRVFEKWLLEGR